MKKLNTKGFTLIELLVSIAILSVISSISMYIVMNVFTEANEKTYLTTKNNIENTAGNYLIENSDKLFFVGNYSNENESQCVTVGDLIDAGYFDDSILESKYASDKVVEKNLPVYIERNKKTKKITKTILAANQNQSDYCFALIENAEMDINCRYEPEEWAKKKNLTITYSLNNVYSDSSLQKYFYDYSSDIINVEKQVFKDKGNTVLSNILIKDNMDVFANIYKGEEIVANKTCRVLKIDSVEPTVNINRIAYNTFSYTLTDGDKQSGVTEYAITKSNVVPTEWIDIDNDSNYKYTINSSGTYYVWAKDKAGNVSSSSIKAYSLTKNQGTNTTLTIKENSSSGDPINGYALSGTEIYVGATSATGYSVSSLKVNNGDHINGNTFTIKGDATINSVAKVNSYKLTLTKGTGISKIYYKIGNGDWKSTISNTTVEVNYGTKVYAYGEAATGYTYTANSKDSPWSGTMGTSGLTFNPSAKINTVTVYYYANGGTLGSSTNSSRYAINSSSGLISMDGSTLTKVINYGASGDLANVNSSTWLNVTKKGYSAVSGAQWKCKSGSSCGKTTYNQGTSYSSSDICDASVKNCSINVEANWQINQYTLTLTKGTGISKIHYKIGSGDWKSTTGDTTVKVNYGTKVYAYGEAATGYTYTARSKDSPWEGTMGTSGLTFNPSAKVNSYDLKLVKGTGIGKIHYKIGDGSWTSTTSDKTVKVNYGTKVYAYGEASSGYIYTARSKSTPWEKTMGTSGLTFNPSATNVTPIGSYKCKNISKGTSPYNMVYTGNCEVSGTVQNWKVKFTSDGTLTLVNKTAIDVFLVGGGGGGGSSKKQYWRGGGGGAGGFTKTYKGITVTANKGYSIDIGAGGAGGASDGTNDGATGLPTKAFGYTVNGGGGGGAATCWTGEGGCNTKRRYHGGTGGSGGGAGGHNGGAAQPGNGGSFGSNGFDNDAKNGFGGTGQGTTTCEFGEGTLTKCNTGITAYAGGGGGGKGLGSANKNATDGKPGSGSTYGQGGQGASGGNTAESGANGYSGIVIIRNKR